LAGIADNTRNEIQANKNDFEKVLAFILHGLPNGKDTELPALLEISAKGGLNPVFIILRSLA
jgi:hypothetical protein